MNTKTIIGIVAALIIIGGGSFYGGMKYDQSTNKPSSALTGGFRRGQGVGAGFGGGLIVGNILSVDPTGITVQLRTGGSKIVFVSSGTSVTKSVAGGPQDLATGKQVMISGQANSDGSINATSIQIRPNMSTSTTAASQ